MAEIWVSNASPIITLAKVGRLDLFDLAEQLLIPDAVAQEILAGPADDPARLALERGLGERSAASSIRKPSSSGAWERAKPKYWRSPSKIRGASPCSTTEWRAAARVLLRCP